MVHAFRLIAATGWTEEAPRLWARRCPSCARSSRRGAWQREMVGFAEALFTETDGRIPVGHGHFVVLWPEAARILSQT